MILRAHRWLRLNFVSILQQFYAIYGTPDPQFPEQSPPLNPANTNFTWRPDIKTTGIFIDERFRVDYRKYPALIVDTVMGQAFFRSLQEEFQVGTYAPIPGFTSVDGLTTTGLVSIRHGGPLNLTVTIKAYDYDPKNVERIVDRLITGLRFLVISKFRLAGIEILDVRLGAESEETIGNDQLFSYQVDVDTYSEFEVTVPVDVLTLINGIQIPDYNGLITILPDGTTDPYF
jgi:hypothetical protein